ncbi:O-antigen ligase family protein [Rhodococcus sp. T7]|uniref:O-antigen ligase family protein n=1 Tax=Rhodococcus sp. T7 TaxID=627444 RepID=UPI0013588224|nr:O-antigen ligase family protein [Rhodococcus sp. T7]
MVVAVAQTLIAFIELVVTHIPILWGYGRYADGTEVKLANPLLGPEIVRTQGTMGHPIVLSTLLVIAVLIIIDGGTIRTRWIKYPIFGLLAFGLLISGTRSAFVALAIAVVFSSVLHVNARDRWRNLITVLAVSGTLLIFDFGIRQIWADLVGSGSYTNRAAAISALPGLFNLNISRLLLGSGFGSENDLFQAGYLQQNGFRIVDNQLVTTIATNGLFGFVILIALITVGIAKGNSLFGSALVAMGVMMFSFDYLRWPAIAFLFFILVALGAGSTRSDLGRDARPHAGSSNKKNADLVLAREGYVA